MDTFFGGSVEAVVSTLLRTRSQRQTEARVNLRPLRNVVVESSLGFATLNGPAGDPLFSGWIARSRIDIQFNRELRLRLFGQYDDFDETLGSQPLLSYELNPFSIFFLGATLDYEGDTATSAPRPRTPAFHEIAVAVQAVMPARHAVRPVSVRTSLPEVIMRLAPFLFLMLAVPVSGLHAQTPPDSAAIRQAALDYIEGWYTGDAERMGRAVHPGLAKRNVLRDPGSGRSRLRQMSADQLVQSTREGGGRDTPPGERRQGVDILDIYQGAASVKIIATEFIDYLHLVQADGRWVIINVLTELRPEAR